MNFSTGSITIINGGMSGDTCSAGIPIIIRRLTTACLSTMRMGPFIMAAGIMVAERTASSTVSMALVNLK